MTHSALRRYRAERLLRKDFPLLRAKVLAVVRSRLATKGIALGHADLEDCYSQAFAGLYTTVLEGEEVENPTGWLVTVTFRRAIDESRAAARRKTAWEELTVGRSLVSCEDLSSAAPDRDVAGALDDRATLRHLFEGLRSTFSRRECEAASLCYLQGLTRAEAAKQMNISETRMRKLMEGDTPGRQGVASKVGELLTTIKAGEWCEQQSSLMRAYAFGILDPEGDRHELAVAHTRECPACRAHVASLRGLAAVLPPLPLTLLLAGGGGVLAGTRKVVGRGARRGAGAKAGVAARSSSAAPGSLTVKLAVTAVIVIGGGYGVLDSHAHGSAPGTRDGARTLGVSESFAQGREAPGVTTRPKARFSKRRPTHTHTHTRSTRKPGSIARASNNEFGPERVGSSSTPAISTAASGSGGRGTATGPRAGARGSATTPRGGGEFGFE